MQTTFTCFQCGVERVVNSIGRPATKFCSRKCKEDARTAGRRGVRIVARQDRRCLFCDKQMDPLQFGKAKCCTKTCSVAYQNRLRSVAATERRQATRHPCLRCGKTPDIARKGPSLYCSVECKQPTMGDRYRSRYPGHQRMRLYGLSHIQYAAMLDAQNHRCAVCGTDKPGGRGNFVVDHDHTTDAVRGLLCSNCNVGLGNFRDSPEFLRAAVAYLERHSVASE